MTVMMERYVVYGKKKAKPKAPKTSDVPGPLSVASSTSTAN